MYGLLGYGIPVEVFPVGESGVIKKMHLNRWISKYKAREKTPLHTGAVFRGIDLPTHSDVLTGTGKPIRQHLGNVYLRDLVGLFMEEFISMKMEAVEKVHSLIKARLGRFLYQCSDGWWWELSEANALEKVRTTFLTARTRQGRETRRSAVTSTVTTESMDISLFLPQGKRPRYDTSCCWNQGA